MVSWRLLQRLLNCLSFFAQDTLIGVAHTLALVRFRRIKAADFSRHLPDDLPIRPFNGQFRVFLDRDLDLIGNGIIDWVGVTKIEVNSLALHGGLEADA